MTRQTRFIRSLFAGIRFRFTIALLLVVVLPVAVVVAILTRWTYDDAERQGLRAQQQTAAVVESEVRSKVLGVESQMRVLDEVLALHTLAPDEQRVTLENLLANNRIYQQLTLVDITSRDEIRVSRTGRTTGSELLVQANDQAIEAVITTKESHFGFVFFDEQLREPLTTVAVAIQNRRTGTIDSVLVATTRFKLIWDLLGELEGPGESDVYIVTDRGLVVAHSNPAVVLSGREIALPPRGGRSIGLSGEDVVFASLPLDVGSQRLLVVSERPTPIVLSAADRALSVLIGVTVGGLLVTIVLVALLTRRILKPIEALAESANKVTGGNLSHRVDETSRGEIGMLARSFNTMTSRLGETIASLEERVSSRTAELEAAGAVQAELIERLEVQAASDFLTGLPNRYALDRHLKIELGRARRLGSRMTVLLIDLDNFKDVNDTFGHSVGDELLVAVAERLRETLREVDLICRLGGDEFAVVQADIAGKEEAENLAKRLLAAFGKGFELGSQEIFSGVSIGVSISTHEMTSISDLMQQADVALYRSKNAGRGTYRFFEDVMDAEIQRRVRLSQGLRMAIDRDELFLEYQPQVALEDRQIVGVEALLRWRHPSFGVIDPSELVPIAEGAGLIDGIGEWVLRTACTTAQSWQANDVTIAVPIAVNVSAIQLRDPGFAAMVSRIVDESGIDPRCLELELTETVLMASEKDVDQTLQALKATGVHIALDDFGKGYASLDYLRRYPFTKVKIDGSFVQGMLTDSKNAVIVDAIIDLTQELGLHVVAEGVETADLLERLISGGCRSAQGFHFSRPVSAERFEALLILGSDQISAYQGSAVLPLH